MSAQPHSKLDSYRIEIIGSALTAITEEIELTILRTAYSHNVKEGHDASCVIFNGKGHIVAQSIGIPGHLGSMKFMIEEVLKTFPVESMRPGDVFISNHPYRGGGHLPDIGMFRPVFHDSRCVAFTGCMAHHTDVGGMSPGSNPVRAIELYQEGLVLPPVKLREADRENATLFDIIRANVRQPDVMLGDLRAQEAALLKGEQRLRDLLDRYGAEGVTGAMEMLIDYSERKAREAVAAIPNGSYEFEDFMDHDGIDLSHPVRIKVRLDVLDDRLRFDFTGTDPQVQGPINATLSLTWTSVFVCVSCILPDDVPFNEGLTRVIEVHAPEGTIINPRHPAPVNARSVTLQRIVDAVLGALALAVPERVGAQSCGVVVGVSFGGIDPRTGKSFVFYEAYCGGLGGTRSGDGADGISCGVANPQNIPAEVVEMDYPVRIHRFELVRDSGGSGEFRGGLGLKREYEMLAETATFNVRGERSAFAPRGSYGGGNGSLSNAYLEDGEGKLNPIPSKYTGQIQRGRRLLIVQPGGGGFGDPARRSRSQLVADYLGGKMSAEKIKKDFGVDITAEVNDPRRRAASTR